MNWKTVKLYIELSKPGITQFVVLSALLGYLLGSGGHLIWSDMIWMIAGVALSCAGSSTLNQYLERDADKLMKRTCKRPLPTGEIDAFHALVFGSVCILLGVTVLYVTINILTAFLSLLTAFMYVLVYTPLKRVSWWNTTIGAIPGAIPPLGGWAAATGHLDFGAGVLFAILFLWQHPHFYAISWLCKADYKNAGFKMLPVVKEDGGSMFIWIIATAGALIPISLLPSAIGLSGPLYFWGALIAGILFYISSHLFKQSHTMHDARMLLRASIIYLPVLIALILIDFSLSGSFSSNLLVKQ